MQIRDFSKYKDVLPIPNLIRLQLEAYECFLQKNVMPARRKKIGLEALFQNTFPVKSYDGTISMEYLGYELGEPRYSPEECRDLKLTYGIPLKVRLRLNRSETIEENVYLGEVPMMVGGGEFVVNGVKRVIVSQLHRSPGIDMKEESTGESKLFSACIVPERGSWLEAEIGKKTNINIRVDQSGKMPITIFLKAMDEKLSSHADIIRTFYETEVIKVSKNLEPDTLTGKYVVTNVIDPTSGKVALEAGNPILPEIAKFIIAAAITEIEVINNLDSHLILNTLAEDRTTSHEEALLRMYARLRPGMPMQLDHAKKAFYERFCDPNRYLLGAVGRFRLNRKFGLDIPETEQTLQTEDIINTIKHLIRMHKNEIGPDDIDHLGNRRVRLINELAVEDMRKGFYRLKRAVTERLSLSDEQMLTPRSLINPKIISSAIKHFFERGELSQVVDQTNPLAQLTHERRLSALGPGGLNRKRAGFEVRDVHISHYGRICPIETPEGANIGLITSLGIFTFIDKKGFLTTPYQQVKNGRITNEILYLRADEETDKVIAPINVSIDKNGTILGEKVLIRMNGEFKLLPPGEINYMDVSSRQLVGVSAGLIPFLEHNDANRALMGSNMQRQAVPLLTTAPPSISTGLEKYVALNSDMLEVAEKEGVVSKVTADQIVIRTDDEEGSDFKTYQLRKFTGLNEGTCLNQKPIIREGDKVKKGQVIADGPGTCQGELALGKDVLIAFMPWGGYNFEDAIVVSDRLLKDSTFTSLHIENFEVEIRETKTGREEFTRDIPNVPEKALRHLGEDGIIKIGTKVKAGDILVGKIVPKSKSELTPEEKLLHAIFGKAGEDVRNESLETPPGTEGIVIDTKRFSRRTRVTPKVEIKLNKTAKKIQKDYHEQFLTFLGENIKSIEKLIGKRLLPRPLTYGPRGTIKSLNALKEKLDLSREDLGLNLVDKKIRSQIEQRIKTLLSRCEKIENEKETKINHLMRGDNLPSGVLEKIKIRIATKRNLSVGDKMAGRHGNKGVVAKILPQENMPYLEDGTPLDVLLNPLGVPSRMNVGQILETHLGWAAKTLNYRVITPVFNGASEKEITNALEEANLPSDGKTTLYDGRSGEAFTEKVTVGYAYLMKLHHLVDDKIHARATGPYSLITQQPLGGKARYGGQRFGEMEVWALEAYGAANVLQEMLTVKSDDVDGRTKIYESIVKGENLLEPGTPVSLEVLINEIKGLCLDLKLEKSRK